MKSINAEWIPCSERLPNCDWGSEVGNFLFQLKNTGTMYTGYYGTGGKYRDRYFRTYNNTTEGFDVDDVAAWMPLPKPYCEETDMNDTTPKCHWTSSNAYPHCFGAKNPQEFAENDCHTCPWYDEYWHKYKKKQMKAFKKYMKYLKKKLVYKE